MADRPTALDELILRGLSGKNAAVVNPPDGRTAAGTLSPLLKEMRKDGNWERGGRRRRGRKKSDFSFHVAKLFARFTASGQTFHGNK